MNKCCEDLSNRGEPEWSFSNGAEKSDIKITVCKVCGCRHYEVDVDPVRLGVKILP